MNLQRTQTHTGAHATHSALFEKAACANFNLSAAAAAHAPKLRKHQAIPTHATKLLSKLS